MKIIILGKSGVGKTTQEALLKKALGINSLVSTTTRLPRPGEQEGVEYHFVSTAEFEAMDARGELLERADFRGCFYGLQRKHVTEDFVAVLEPVGAATLCEIFRDIITIKLVLPEALRQNRLNARGVEISGQDEDRFDAFKADYEIDVSGTVDDVLSKILKVLKKA